MRSNDKSSLHIEEVASQDQKSPSQIATAIPLPPPLSSWQHWYRAFTHVLPVYIAVHLAFIIIAVFSQLFILRDLSAKVLPLHTLWEVWYRFDAKGYIGIAMQGYNTLSKSAIFPLYPLLIKCLTYLIPNPLLAGLVISDLAGLFLLVVLYRLVQEDFDAVRAYRTILYLSLFPSAFFLAAAYSESVFLCLILLSFYHMRRGHWWLAAAFGFFASLTRSAGILMLLPFLYEYLHQHRFQLKAIRFDIMGGVCIPAGLGIFALYCYFRFHDPFAFSHVEQNLWSRQLSFPGYGMLLSFESILQSPGLLSFRALRNILELGADLFILSLIVLSFIGPWKFPRHLWSYSIYAVTFYLFLQFFPVRNVFPLESTTRYMLQIFPAFIVLAGIGKSRMLNLNYLVISGALLFLLLTQFLLGYWIT